MDSTAKVFDSTTADNASRGLGGEGLARHGGVKEKRPHREPCAARNSRASSRRSSFPMADLGSASRNSTCFGTLRSEEHTSELQSPCNLVCRLLLEKKKRLGAALAYYTFFSLAPTPVVIIDVDSLSFGVNASRCERDSELKNLLVDRLAAVAEALT